ncbi:hypothetical protein HY285_03440 [Candidatus Peregrinibacteria bacterium]|nr:hypothetical protein [Candidatus Peregrinibacteria bacterium]MBI3816569.1 hypothetical protein [Candidatus Peregrinibacteria bacterium]
MADTWFDHIPSHERQKIRRRMRSPEEYERLRERVKGPEDLDEEMRKNEALADLRFGIETEPAFHDGLKFAIDRQIQNEGLESVLESPPKNPQLTKALERGKFTLTVSSHPKTHQDQIMVQPEGTVQEKLPLKPSLSDQYVSQFARDF